MSIKGLTDRGLSFPEIGQIRKGAKKGENKPGADLQYFRVEFDEREKKSAETFFQKYGPQPTEINILLPFNEVEKCFDAWLEAYSAGRMVARSDGEKYLYRVDTKTGAVLVKNGEPFTPYVEGEVVGTWKNRKNGKEESIICKPVGRLKIVIPELQRLAYLVVMTTSKHDIMNLWSQLNTLRQINGGRLAGIPLILRRRPKKISAPGTDDSGQARRFTKWMLSIEADPEWVKAKLLEVKKLALPGNGLALLPEPEPHDEEPETETEPEDEWEPPSQAQEGEFAPEPDEQPDPEQGMKETAESLGAVVAEEDVNEALEAARKVKTTAGKELGSFDLNALVNMKSQLEEVAQNKRGIKWQEMASALNLLIDEAEHKQS